MRIFPDPNLEAAVRWALDLRDGELTQPDLDRLTWLTADDCDVADLTGLERCGSLTWLYLDGNQVVDVSPLAGLTARIYR